MFAWLTPCPRLCWEYEVLPARSEAMIYACDDPVDGAMAGSLILFRQLLRDLGQGHLNFDDAAVVGRGHREWSLSCGIRACILDLRACILNLPACILSMPETRRGHPGQVAQVGGGNDNHTKRPSIEDDQPTHRTTSPRQTGGAFPLGPP